MKDLFLAVRYGVLGVVFASSMVGCTVKRPDTVFTDVQMEDILCDYHKAKAMMDEIPYDESYKKILYLESVFHKHGITQAEFDSSMVWFTRHPDVLAKIYDQVKSRLKAEQNVVNRLIAIRDNRPEESMPGDSIDVWLWKRVYQLTGMPLDNKLAFELPVDTNFKNRDTLVWTVRLSATDIDSIYAPQMAMQIFYNNDTLLGGPIAIRTNGVHSLSLSADTLGEMKEVRGFIYYPSQEYGSSILLDSIRLMRYHATDTLKVQHSTESAEQSIRKPHDESGNKTVQKVKESAATRRTLRPRPTKD